MVRILSGVLLAPLLVFGLGGPAAAQVYRCGDSRLYTDKPCDRATPIDLRANILDAGPRTLAPEPEAVPAPPVIPPDPTPAPQAGSAPGNVFDQRDARDSEFRARTGPFH